MEGRVLQHIFSSFEKNPIYSQGLNLYKLQYVSLEEVKILSFQQ